jgi:crossover junction endodeoxyribonuclease RuvC
MPKSRRWSSADVEKSATGRLVAKPHKAAMGKAKKAVPSAINAQLSLRSRGMRDGVVLGIDPSLRGTGLAVIKFSKGKPTLLFSQVIKTKGDMPAALGQITQSVKNVCEQYKPDAAAIESTIFAQNHRTAITLGASRGAAVAVLSLYAIPCTDLAPTRIKQAVVGTGRASKEQVAKMVQALLKLPAPLASFDESDAAAAALAVVF